MSPNRTGQGAQYSCIYGGHGPQTVDDIFVREALEYEGNQIECFKCGVVNSTGMPACSL